MLDDWARKWGVSPAALADLRSQLGAGASPEKTIPGGISEAAVQSHVWMRAASMGWKLWRNNVGSLQDERGRWLRYGLCNDSRQINEKFKSADLVGIRPVLVMPHHVGTVIGQFVSVECKHARWKYVGDEHERAQVAWASLVASSGGHATFASDPSQLIP